MLILADLFEVLPEGCPVMVVNVPGIIVGQHSAREWKIQSCVSKALRTPHIQVVDKAMFRVDLSTPAAIRAFAPALIVAVRFPEGRYNDSRFPPMPLRDLARDTYTLIGYILDSGALCAYMPRHELVTGATPEEALLNGLKATLDAACVAVGGAP